MRLFLHVFALQNVFSLRLAGTVFTLNGRPVQNSFTSNSVDKNPIEAKAVESFPTHHELH